VTVRSSVPRTTVSSRLPVAPADLAHEDALALREPHRRAQPSGDMGRRHGHAQPGPPRDLAVGQAVEPTGELGGGGDGHVEAVATPVGVDAQQPPGRVQHGPAGGAPGESGVVLEGARHQRSTGAAEPGVQGRDGADGGHQAAVAGAGQRHDRLAEAYVAVEALDRGRTRGVHLDDRQVAAQVGARDGAQAHVAVGEAHVHLVAAQVVRVRDDPAVRDDHAAAAPDGDHGVRRSVRGGRDRRLDVLFPTHVRLLVASGYGSHSDSVEHSDPRRGRRHPCAPHA
jgi:hypothetical protein